MTLQTRIQRLLAERGMSQAQLARAAGCERATVGDWYHGRTKQIRGDLLLRAAKALGVAPEYLNGETRHRGGSSTPADSVRIPWLTEQDMGDGDGEAPADGSMIRALETSREWARERLGRATSIDNVRIYTGVGDSMASTYNDGDALFIDTGVRLVKVDAVFAFRQANTGVFVRRIQRLPDGGMNLISDNSRYPPIEIPEHKIAHYRVVGRVIGSMNFHAQ